MFPFSRQRKTTLDHEHYLNQAERLLWLGFPAPAAVMARVALEKILRALYRQDNPKGNKGEAFIATHCGRLWARQMNKPGLTRDYFQRLLKTGSHAAHGVSVDRHEVRWMIQNLRDLCVVLSDNPEHRRRCFFSLRRRARFTAALAEVLAQHKAIDA